MPVDLDGDGQPADLECDDTDARIHPGASTVCDGLDNDCDGAVDDNPADASTVPETSEIRWEVVDQGINEDVIF